MKYFSHDYERWLDSSIYLRKEIKKLLDSHYLDSQQKGIENQNKTITCFDQNYFIQKNEEEVLKVCYLIFKKSFFFKVMLIKYNNLSLQ